MATFFGSAAGETITGTDQADSISGGGGPDSLVGAGGDDTISSGNTDAAASATLSGGAGNDLLTGGAGADSINGGTGVDTMIGGGGSDTYFVDNVADIIREGATGGSDTVNASVGYALNSGAQVETLTLADAAGSTFITGNEFAQIVNGNASANTISGGRNTPGTTLGDTLVGNGGSDNFVINNEFDRATGAGTGNTAFVDADSLLASGQLVASWDAGTSTGIQTISARSQAGTQSLNLTGNAGAETIIGNFGNNVLSTGGGAGVDTLIGLQGNDTYKADLAEAGTANLVIREAAGEGTDTLVLTGNASYDLSSKNNAASIELITVDDAFINSTLTGNSVAQTLDASKTGEQGTAAGVTLVGGGGADTLIGGEGQDTFRVDSADDVIQDRQVLEDDATDDNPASIEENSLVYTGATGGYDLADGINISSMSATGTGDVYLVGNNFAQTITGNSGNNILNGDGAPSGEGDTLDGGAGDDVYRIYSANDQVIDSAGTDIVYSSAAEISLNTLAPDGGIETLSAFNQSSAAIDYKFTGGAGGNRLIGAAGNDTLIASGGIDTLIGLNGNDTYVVSAKATSASNDVIQEVAGGGNDTLFVNGTGINYALGKGVAIETLRIGNDAFNATLTGNEFGQTLNASNATEMVTLNGGGGDDTLIGGQMADTFVVDSASDVIIDANGTVANSIQFNGASGGYQIGANLNIEALSAVGDAAENDVYLVGNEFSQTITGGDGNDILNGNGGVSGAVDRLIGNAGDDIYRVFNSGDVVVEVAGEGFDTVYTSVNYQLQMGSSVEQLSAATQSGTESLTLIANEMANRVIGNQGSNILAGGSGNDTLIGLGGADTFSFSNVGAQNADVIQDFNSSEGDKIQLVNSVFNVGNSLAASEFTVGTAATTNGPEIIYDQSTGRLFYDADGAGTTSTAQLFATVDPGTQLSASDFTVVATAPMVP